MRVKLIVVAGPHEGREFSFSEHDNFIVGRGKQAHFRLSMKDPYFSRIHFMVEVNPPVCRLMDMQSTNGTVVNSRRVKRSDLSDGDVIGGGDTKIRVSIEVGQPLSPEQTIAPPKRNRALDGPGGNRASDATLAPPTGKAERALERLVRESDRARQKNSATPPPNVEPASQGLESTADMPAGCEVLPNDYEEMIRNSPQPIAGYQIIKEIGRGAMGVVYLALSIAGNAVVALKMIKPAVEASREDLVRFSREASILKSLSHPSIVAFRDMGESDGMLYFAMDYVQGQDASKLVRSHGELFSVWRAVNIACQMLEALEYAHGQGFVHRDIKPANLMVAEHDGREVAVLSDFGLARHYHASKLSGLTMMGDVAGTTPYMPPEQITHYRDAKPTVDQYAAAATLYFLLTKKHIYDFPHDVSQQLMMILQKAPVPIEERRSDIPKRLAEIVHRGLTREPADRFGDVGEMRAELLGFCGS